GGSSSGKTTVVNKIISNFLTEKVEVIRHDDYYKDQSEMTIEERRKINYDHPLSLDNDLFYSQVLDLVNGKSIDKPTYDFVELNRTKITEKVYPAEIIILEGILILEDERIRNLADIKIFVEADDDIRLIRRIKRDTTERGRTLDNVLNQYLSTVKPMHHAFVKPTKRYADIIIPNDYSHDVAVDLIKAKIFTILNQ
ncbi:MAG TPA: uridine kinase, partial [Bacillota bacterium]|nr:uridine kinase [Bacillota bacterium]